MRANLTVSPASQWHPLQNPGTPNGRDIAEEEWHSHSLASGDWRPSPPLMDSNQFSEAFRRGYPMTLRFLFSRGAATGVAEEIAQAAWVKGWECLDQLQRPHMIGAWVNSIAKNMLKNCHRSDQKLKGLTECSQAAGPAFIGIDVKSILTRCGRRDSRILRGYYIEGYTAEELARQVGMTAVTVRVRLMRIRRALRSQLTKPPVVTPHYQAA